ncbi:hypothetical protein EX30DRAFT_64205 [Ascodesmis nigricans]|uniref:Uncharacterized protein n=1 Tax=Ascodesmis nigricans TaxID=341454 RepID=A0A4S2MUH7_9PEZI|nr:hypothetical protein EX30DRAFT_64205 [Ascodesmis nigricans]
MGMVGERSSACSCALGCTEAAIKGERLSRLLRVFVDIASSSIRDSTLSSRSDPSRIHFHYSMSLHKVHIFNMLSITIPDHQAPKPVRCSINIVTIHHYTMGPHRPHDTTMVVPQHASSPQIAKHPHSIFRRNDHYPPI